VRVIVTRPEREAKKWVQQLSEAGFDTWALPLIQVGPAPDRNAVITAWARMDNFDAVMFVSGNAVEQFFALKPPLAHVFTAQSATKIRAFVTGPGSRSALLAAGVDPECIVLPDLHAGVFDSEALWAVAGCHVVPGYRVLLVRGSNEEDADAPQGQGRDWFSQQVLASGGRVEVVVSYQRHCPAFTAAQRAWVPDAASDGSLWLFSSSQAIAYLTTAFAGQVWSGARALATHPRIAEAARAAGFGEVRTVSPSLSAVKASIESMA
jgi:uroporphyrinogen-III synthase